MTATSLELDLDETFDAGRPGSAPPDGAPRFRLVGSRDVEPTDAAPLLYRERAFVVPKGCDQPTLEAFLLDRLAELRSKLAGAQASARLVVLAGFDHADGARPKGAPRATLTWKDWRPDLAELRAEGGKPRDLQLVARSAATPTPRPAEKSKAKSKGRVSQAPRPAERRRLSADDLIGELFEAMIDLHFEHDAVAGAHFVLGLLRDKLHVAGALVSLFDLGRREFVVVAEHGGSGSALLHRQKQHQKLVDVAHRTRRAVVVADVAGDARVHLAHWDALGLAPKSVICAPVASGGRTLGLIELANPRDGAAFGEAEGNAVLYAAEQLAEFIAERGVSIDEEAVRHAHAERSTP